MTCAVPVVTLTAGFVCSTERLLLQRYSAGFQEKVSRPVPTLESLAGFTVRRPTCLKQPSHLAASSRAPLALIRSNYASTVAADCCVHCFLQFPFLNLAENAGTVGLHSSADMPREEAQETKQLLQAGQLQLLFPLFSLHSVR